MVTFVTMYYKWSSFFQAGSASLKDVAEAEIFDTLAVKQNAIKMACNAAVTILRVDQVGCYVPGYRRPLVCSTNLFKAVLRFWILSVVQVLYQKISSLIFALGGIAKLKDIYNSLSWFSCLKEQYKRICKYFFSQICNRM